MSKHLLLVDASGFAHRAFYSRAAKYRSDGLPIWATIGFMDMVWAMLQRAKSDPPTHGAAVFDAPGKNFRHKIYPAYKAHRPEARREELKPQMPYMRHAAAALGLVPVEAAGWEADDVIATLATQAAAQGIRVTIISSDKDFCQLVRDGVVEIIEPIGKKRVTAAGVKARFGCAPDLVPDVQALWGDDVDGIPGIDGVGGKTAGALIHKAGGLENLLAIVSRSGMALGTPSQRKAIRQGADNARLYKRLATLDIRVPNMPSIDSLALHKPEVAHLKEVLRVLEVGRLFDVMFGGDPGVTMRLPHVPAPLQWWHGAVKIAASNIAIRELPNDPQDGFFQRKLVKGGPWVPARIWRDAEKDFVTDQETGFDVVKCEVAGKPRHPLKEFDALGRYPITKEKFDHLMAVGNWAKTYAPNSSEANPTQPINWNEEPL